ncbi:arsenic resistance protein [Gulosibacter molinativorax]|uniref:Arsenic resistance protein n=1 Tax=Gulosibacter molinativorax TaxID=256821 RepID=A0ABT7CB69_9MICO|nr:bile acid:sodium symporter [Gulosibacter molinativorax]MDJ1372446.1 arsenic resistance protein [Gulosibacter molinativorax]
MQSVVAWMERQQVLHYLGALGLGGLVGLLAPGVAHPAAVAINPALGLLLYATFLGVPFARIGQAIRDWRFLATVLLLNFVLVPIVVFLVSRFVAHDDALLVGVLFVLLTPCVDYVIVFTGLAGGAKERLLAASPLLMLAQMLLLPLYLWWFVGAEFVVAVDLAPFVEAFLLLILLPLIAAWLTQLAAGTRFGSTIQAAASNSMVPLMMLTLAVAVASQIAEVREELATLVSVVPVYLLFALIMVPVGIGVSRAARLDIPGQRAAVFSGVTRNSLVVLPLVLAMPEPYGLAPLVVVTQTLVELILMVILIRLVPRLVPDLAHS